jgi:serine/threonine protein kinase
MGEKDNMSVMVGNSRCSTSVEDRLKVMNGTLLFDERPVGKSCKESGFSQYYFDDMPLGKGANGITFSVTHKTLNVKQVIKIYFPKENENDLQLKATEEAKKNANTALAGISAIVFDAGEYNYPCKIWYSIMESVTSYCTIKQWRERRNEYFVQNKKFDIDDSSCRSSIHTSINLAAGLLKATIIMYENEIIHGDLNPGNILWVLLRGDLDEELKYFSSYSYSTLGELSPYTVKLIDLGASQANTIKEVGIYRDAIKIFEHMKSFLSPIFVGQKYRFEDWFIFNVTKIDQGETIGLNSVLEIEESGNHYIVDPKMLAGDMFRLLGVLTIALGIVTNQSHDSEITLETMDKNDFYILMHEEAIRDGIKAFSFDTMSTLEKVYKLQSGGHLIKWENVWNSYPLNLINSTGIKYKESDDF